MLPLLSGEFGIVKEPELTFTSKGDARLKLRVLAKDRVRDANGKWSDGSPWFADVIVWGKTAEHMFESIASGDTVVIANAKAEQYDYVDKEGNKRTNSQFVAEMIGVSVKWGPVKTRRAEENSISTVVDMLGATPVQAEMSPF